MALKSTIYRAELDVANVDVDTYASFSLTLARHPSETEERLMLRLLAFALFADSRLEFGRGLSTDDEPDLWLKDETGQVQLWVEIGLPDPRRLRRAAGRAHRLVVIAFGGRGVEVWQQRNTEDLAQIERLEVFGIRQQDSKALADLAARSMRLHCTIQDGQICIGDASRTLFIEPERLKA